ncbi:MAG UNVERIFIED_CONTAM: retropepsin-like domain-containing protein, partial [Methylobacterium ajmalii]
MDIPLDSRIGAEVKISGQKFRALFDTGATDSFIDTRHAEKFGEKVRSYSRPVELRMFDGRTSSSGALMHYIDTHLAVTSADQRTYFMRVRLNVTKLCGSDVVLGSRWMRENRGVLDMGRRQLTISVPNLSKEPKNVGRDTTTIKAQEAVTTNLAAIGPSRQVRKRNSQKSRRFNQGQEVPPKNVESPATYPNNIPLQSNRYEDVSGAVQLEEVDDVGDDVPEATRDSRLFALLRALATEPVPKVPEIEESAKR